MLFQLKSKLYSRYLTHIHTIMYVYTLSLLYSSYSTPFVPKLITQSEDCLFLFYYFMCMGVLLHVCLCTIRMPVAFKDQKGHQIPRNWSYRWL